MSDDDFKEYLKAEKTLIERGKKATTMAEINQIELEFDLLDKRYGLNQ
jgi:hypothetical protein